MADDEPIRALLESHNIEAPPYLENIVADIAERYRKAVSDQSESHRIADIDKDLAAIAEAATHLSDLLEHLHPDTYALMAGDWQLPGQLHPIDREEMTKHIPLAVLAPDNPPRAEVGLLRTLREFGEFAHVARQALVAAWSQRRDDGKLDPGGNWNLYSLKNARPKWALARDCHYVLTEYLKESATGTVGGLFYSFVAAVYQDAAGEDPEEPGVGLEFYVKNVVAYARRVEFLERRFELAQTILQRPGLTEERTNRLLSRKMRLQEQLHDAETLRRLSR